ncbi:hypothetical protein ADMFC3_10220 [Geovibrio sp. ADMFC3]
MGVTLTAFGLDRGIADVPPSLLLLEPQLIDIKENISAVRIRIIVLAGNFPKCSNLIFSPVIY